MKPSTYDSVTQNHYGIHARASQPAPGSRWIVTVDIQRPDGTWLPTIRNHDETYETAAAALAAGIEHGQHFVSYR